MGEPLILTLQLDARSQGFYEELRQRYFPPERNLIAAHLTMFHSLPDEDFVVQTVSEAAQANVRFSLTAPNARSIGRGVAVFFQSAPLIDLHAKLSAAFKADLIPQDRQRFQPHVVVQNKVEPGAARQTLEKVRSIQLVEPRAIGLSLWRYLGGPWERIGDSQFGELAASYERP